ncbi:hypothetical protein [Streptomyces sp. NPDC059802]|uniref:hypothetical protein n=1 Tax=Streptomyces sp. NPDC059802 TaxID=3346952 RepID=UPI00365F288F
MPSSNDLRNRLTTAAARLREVDSPGLADAVDAVLAPKGWTHLRSTDPVATGTTEPNMIMSISKTVRDQIVAARRSPGATVTDDVNEAFTKFLAGEFVPRKPARARHGAPDEKVNLNVRPSSVLRQQVAESAEMTAANVAADYLMRKYGLGPYAADAKAAPLALGSVRIPTVPRTVREEIRTRAATAGRKVNDDVDEGFQKYLAGEFTPTAPVWADTADMVPMKMRPNDTLHDQVLAAGGLRPLQVAVAYLLSKYSITPGAAE